MEILKNLYQTIITGTALRYISQTKLFLMKKLIILLAAVVFSVSTFSQAPVDKGSLEYYQNTYNKAKRQVRTGNILTIAGVTFGALGYFISKKSVFQQGILF